MTDSHANEFQKTPVDLNLCDSMEDDLHTLHRVLTDTGYTEDAIARSVGGGQESYPPDLFGALLRTSEETPFNTLVRLFMLARSVPEEHARHALAPVSLTNLLHLGVLKSGPEGIRSEISLMAFDKYFLARDFWPEFTGRPCPANYVLGVGPASLAVANMTVRKPVETALDIGTGSGFLAILAATHADRVVATDINPRALNFAAFNARLNGVSGIDFRLGSRFDPVGDSHFDLIMSNPPFVISPGYDFEYRDNTLGGDAFVESLLRGAPARMSVGGFLTVLFNWHHRNDDDWSHRPGQWLKENGCDAWLVCSKTVDPISYAITWLRREHSADPERYQALLNQWLAYYEQTGVGRISTGAAILRRRSSGSGWLHLEKAPSEDASGSCSDQIQRIFAARDLLETLSDDRELLNMALILTPDHQLTHELQAENDRWSVKKATLIQTRGLQYTGHVDQLVGTLLAGCNGKRTLSQLAADISTGMNVAPDKVIPSCLQVARKLLETGFLSVA